MCFCTAAATVLFERSLPARYAYFYPYDIPIYTNTQLAAK